ncbi:MAG TPA: nuclear transport factor 2 family protein [Propionibacteriaceae bacterium]|nr:nuclear transport factor 2 family protein [Propionibacteriaceae bacterium]
MSNGTATIREIGLRLPLSRTHASAAGRASAVADARLPEWIHNSRFSRPQSRAAALAAGDASRLGDLLHAEFRWTSHTGESFDRASYLQSNAGGRTRWRGQDLGDAEVLVVGDAAVLRTVVTDTIDRADGTETYYMPMTQFWVRTGDGCTRRAAATGTGPRYAKSSRPGRRRPVCSSIGMGRRPGGLWTIS